MLRDKYDEDKFFEAIQRLASEMDAELTCVDQLLEDEALYQAVKADLGRRYPQTLRTGRGSTPAAVIVRLLVVKHLYNWSYEQTERQVRDSLVLRRFCRVYFENVPDHSTLNKWALTIQPATVAALNERVMALAVKKKLTAGRKVRTDGTVVETNIHYPTDSSLLYDSVRVLSRVIKRARQVLSQLAPATFRDRTRTAKYTAQAIGRQARRGVAAVRGAYERLVRTSQASLKQARTVRAALQMNTSAAAQRVREQLSRFMPRVEQVIEQTLRRVFGGEKLPPANKLVSLFEPQTAIIQRGKANCETEFGRKIWLSEVEGGFISHYTILSGNPADEAQWQPSLQAHVRLFAHPPRLASADRGVSSSDNEAYAHQLGVKRVVLPKRGAKDDARRRFEQQSWFRRARRWQAGVEGRISVLKRKHGLRRCLNHGDQGFARWVGWGIFAHNLGQMGHALAH
jgi:IS5 family transposase